MSLIDTLDDLVHSGRIEPQTAMKVIATFDKSITEVLADKVKARMNFKVAAPCCFLRSGFLTDTDIAKRAIWIPTVSATKSGRS